jgi:multidrug efflux pump subunit AcrB
MKVQNFPDIDLPTVTVTASLPGAAPAQLETDVARKIENSIATLQGLKHIYTKVQDGGVTLTAEFRLEKPVQEAVDDVRSAVARARRPAGRRARPGRHQDGPGGPAHSGLHRARQRMDDEALSWFVDNTVARRLLAVRGVGAVKRVGGVEREVRVALDPLQLQALGASAAEVSRQLRQVQLESAGGRADLGGAEQPVRTLATVQTRPNWPAGPGAGRRPPCCASTRWPGQRHRGRAARPRCSTASRWSASRSRAAAAPASRGRRGVRRRWPAARRAPRHADHRGLQLRDAGAGDYDGSMHLLYEGALLAVLVVWLFLRDWRATLVSAWRCRCR